MWGGAIKRPYTHSLGMKVAHKLSPLTPQPSPMGQGAAGWALGAVLCWSPGARFNGSPRMLPGCQPRIEQGVRGVPPRPKEKNLIASGYSLLGSRVLLTREAGPPYSRGGYSLLLEYSRGGYPLLARHHTAAGHAPPSWVSPDFSGQIQGIFGRISAEPHAHMLGGTQCGRSAAY